jgi:hypothetical protein
MAVNARCGGIRRRGTGMGKPKTRGTRRAVIGMRVRGRVVFE